MVSMMAVSACTGEGVSQCPVDTVPIQIWRGERDSIVTTLSAARKDDGSMTMPRPHPRTGEPSTSRPRPFPPFVTAVTEHVAARLGRDKLCLYSVRSKEQSLLQFVGLGTYVIGNSADTIMPTVQSFDVRPLFGGCRISSPWIDIAFERRPVPWIRAVVRWNTRQFLADQAVLAGAQNVVPDVPTPLTRSEYLSFLREYQKSEIFNKPTTTPVEERVPPDLLWLFRRSKQSNDHEPPYFYSNVNSANNKVVEKGADSYTKLIIALIDRCFASDGANFHYSNILDAVDLISLEQYKIETPLFEQHKYDRPLF